VLASRLCSWPGTEAVAEDSDRSVYPEPADRDGEFRRQEWAAQCRVARRVAPIDIALLARACPAMDDGGHNGHRKDASNVAMSRLSGVACGP
jgi:hypothetical protein